MKQKDKWHILYTYVYKCNPFMSTERKWGEFQRLLTYSWQESRVTQKKHSKTWGFCQVSASSGRCTCRVWPWQCRNHQFPTEVLFKQVMKFTVGVSFFATKNAKQKKELPTWGVHCRTHWRNASGRKADRNETTLEFPPLRASKRNLKSPKMVGFPQSVPPTSSFLNKKFKIKWCLNV